MKMNLKSGFISYFAVF